jgi:hypothetical protein
MAGPQSQSRQMKKSCITGNRTPAAIPPELSRLPFLSDNYKLVNRLFFLFQVYARYGRHTELPVLWSVSNTYYDTVLCCILRCRGKIIRFWLCRDVLGKLSFWSEHLQFMHFNAKLDNDVLTFYAINSPACQMSTGTGDL